MTPEKAKIGEGAERRLKVLSSLDTLGAGFQLASHDLDIRGGGNLLGDEQSGHVKEVGFELFQDMLQEAIAAIQSGHVAVADDEWSPQISVGTPIMIPETYVPDLSLRLTLYRRLGAMTGQTEIDGFGAEMIDRFGKMPIETEHLLKVMAIKALSRQAGVDRIDAGPKGLVVGFRANKPPNLPGLVRYIGEQGSLAKLRPDQKIYLNRDWNTAELRLKGTATILKRLAEIAGETTRKAA